MDDRAGLSAVLLPSGSTPPHNVGDAYRGAAVFHSQQGVGNRVERRVQTACSTQVLQYNTDRWMILGLKDRLERDADNLEGKGSIMSAMLVTARVDKTW